MYFFTLLRGEDFLHFFGVLLIYLLWINFIILEGFVSLWGAFDFLLFLCLLLLERPLICKVKVVRIVSLSVLVALSYEFIACLVVHYLYS